ncbi:zinc finger CCCH domain-containing protein 39-like [Solanum lycopersicum]|uniref:C3H1-type domain-containing protein n=1 Tax=Solanum lycopersicum TaxID=4081 RepID=K4BLE4_SOLLC|nr:zinc finger CCCH domain-containing protein 39-like [Solanum lycopersicum]XP_025885922.1 zinc finger CCCH domain-containing protein 39-like [Solanum lycopersicum]
MSTPDNNLEISGKRNEYSGNAECESLKKPIEENSRMAQEGNIPIVPTIHDRQNICRQFKKWGTCPYGEKCCHLHSTDEGEPRESSAIILVNDSQDIGQPKAPVNCTKLKTKLCHQWEMKKRCFYGEKCIFAHGEAEMRSLDSSNPPESRSSADISSLSRNVLATNLESNEKQTIAQAKHRPKLDDLKRNSRIYGDWIE